MYHYSVNITLAQSVTGLRVWQCNFIEKPTSQHVIAAATDESKRMLDSGDRAWAELASHVAQLVEYGGVPVLTEPLRIQSMDVIHRGHRLGRIVVEAISVVDNRSP